MEDSYCLECDASFDSADMLVQPVDQWHERYGCPKCGHIEPRIHLSDNFYGTAFYLLSIADDDHTWPIPMNLPHYEA